MKIFICGLIFVCGFQDGANRWKEGAKGPEGRYSHSSVWDAKDKVMLVFGGESNPQMKFFAELWSFSPDKNTWTEIKTKGSSPAARAYHSAVVDKKRRMWVFGGFKPEFLDDLWAFDLDKKAWTELKPIGPKPSPRDGSSLVYDDKKDELILFGGLKGLQAGGEFKETWSYSIAKNKWTAKKDGPEPRFLAGCAFSPETRRMIIHGGWTLKEGVHSNVWSYDVDKDEWSTKNPAPSNRAAQVAAWDASGRRMIVFGGTGGKTDLNDLAAYDPAKDEWTDLEAGSGPPAKGYLTGAWDGSRMIIWGGVVGGFFGKNASEETWVYSAPRK